MLKINKTLINIDLYGNNIDDEGAKHIVDMLKINTTLTNINLGGNCVINHRSAWKMARSKLERCQLQYRPGRWLGD